MTELIKNSKITSRDHNGKLDESKSSIVKTLLNFQYGETHTCASCKRLIEKQSDAVTLAKVGDVMTYCEACYNEKVLEELEHQNIPPVFTKEAVIVIIGIFLLSTAILFIRTLWFIPPFLYVALLIDIYHMAYEAKAQNEARILRDQYYTYGTYNLFRKERQSIVDIIREEEAKEDVSHLISLMSDRNMETKATTFDVMIYELKSFSKSIWNALSYLRLTLFFMVYTYVIIIILWVFYKISEILN